MIQVPLDILLQMYNKLRPLCQDDLEAINKIIDWIAVKISVDSNALATLPSLEISNYFHSIFDKNEFINNPDDWLGKFVLTLGFSDKVRTNFKLPLISSIDLKNNYPKKIIIKNYSTGAIGIKLNNKYPKLIALYGLVNDLLSYRIAIINKKLYSLPVEILYVESFTISKSNNFNLDSDLWNYSDRWVPFQLVKQ